MIVILHGRNSSASKSRTVRILKEYFNATAPEHTVFAPDYNTEASYAEILNHLYDEVRNFLYGKEGQDNTGELIFIGNSLGGYWARTLASIFRKSTKLIMINPSLKFYPVNRYAGDDPQLAITLFLCKEDKIVPHEYALETYKDRATVHLIYNTGHDFDCLHEYLDLFSSAINRITL